MTTADARPPKFRRRAADRPDEVLDAALAMFTERGYAGATVEGIAARAGLSKAAVYLYFPSKQALLRGLVQRAVGVVADQALAHMQDYRGDPRPVLGQLLRQMAGHLANPDVAAVPALVLREAAHAPDIAQLYRDEVLDRVLPSLRAVLAQGMAGGHIRNLDPDLVIRSVIGPILLHLLLARVFGIHPPDGLAMDRMVETQLAILNAGLAPERKI